MARRKGCERLIATQIKGNLIDRLDDILSDIENILEEFEMSSTLVRNVEGSRRELVKAQKSLKAAELIAEMEASS